MWRWSLSPCRLSIAPRSFTQRLGWRLDADFKDGASVSDLSQALRRAEAAHGEHEKRTGQRDQEWPSWYAEYMVKEQNGEEAADTS